MVISKKSGEIGRKHEISLSIECHQHCVDLLKIAKFPIYNKIYLGILVTYTGPSVLELKPVATVILSEDPMAAFLVLKCTYLTLSCEKSLSMAFWFIFWYYWKSA